ncbi:hypothetical protein [Castellaniella sp.]|uniref:hypothetical protein n=1 Tax=Castellaniella sp. TaxID=1955812 RepID=UPI002AFE253C|nr:hypothetical protein [Castellaniella sp.]
MALELPQSVVLLGARRGVIEPTGAYFATNGSSTFFDPVDPGIDLYDLGQVRVADTRSPEVTASILARALEYEGLSEEDRQRLQEALDAARAGDPLVDYVLADELPLPRAARDLGFGGLRIWENDDWADPSSIFIWDLVAVRKLSDIESAQVRAYFSNEQGAFVESRKNEDGILLVGDQPVVIQTVRDEDGLDVKGANIPEDQLAWLISHYTHIKVLNQLGEVITLSFDMDGETLVAEDGKDIGLQEHQMGSIKATKAAIKAIPSMTASCSDGEWRVTINLYRLSERFPGKSAAWCEAKQEAMAYYTDDADDALGTARKMAEEWAKHSVEWNENAALTDEQNDFIGVLRTEISSLPRQDALHLNEMLHELAARHFVLVSMDVYGDGLSERQDAALEAIEKQIETALEDVPGVKGARFVRDPRGSTVGVNFESGASNSLTGSYKIPLDDRRVQALNNERFWEEYSMPTYYVTLSIDETGNAAFVDLGREEEIARIINVAADKIGDQPGLWGTSFPLHDINGNKVGLFDVVEKRPEGDVSEGCVRLVIETGNAAFEDRAISEVARILRDAALEAELGKEAFQLSDVNGNVVGAYEYKALPSLEHDGVIDMKKALAEGRVYLAEGGYSGLAEDDYRFIVTTADFEPGYGQGEGEVWLVNAKGEIASGYEDKQTVREDLFDKIPKSMSQRLDEVVAGRLSFEDFEREFGDDNDLGLG